MMQMARQRRQAALTLIELLVVMVILVILAGSITFYVANKADQARISRAKADLQTLSTALESYNVAMAEFPSPDQGLEALWAPTKLNAEQQTKWRNGGGPFVKMQNFNDPWNRHYLYANPGPDNHDYDIICYGADGKQGGEGKNADISVWELENRK